VQVEGKGAAFQWLGSRDEGLLYAESFVKANAMSNAQPHDLEGVKVGGVSQELVRS
jgi:hypothetical protein